MRFTAMWWWIDRWRKSTAYTDMTLEEQGAYRNLLDEANLRGGALPNDERILAKACGDALAWSRVRAVVMARFELRADGLHNVTLDEVLYQSTRRAENQAAYRLRRDNKTDNKTDNASHNGRHNQPDSPSPSPSPSPSNGTINRSTEGADNPLAPDRTALESECLRLVREIAATTGKDPTEVMAEAGSWKGGRKINPASMTPDRLLNTVIDLRRMRDGKPARDPPPGSQRAQERQAGAVAMIRGGMRDERGVDAGNGGAREQLEGPRPEHRDAPGPRGFVPPRHGAGDG